MFQILVVEDDSNLRQLMCRVLLKNGYNAVSAEDGKKALEILDSEFIDLMISDVMMPGMDGFELVQSLREAGYNIPVLMVTAKGSFGDKQTGFSIGVDDYMVKPIDVNEMVLRVSALLRRARIINERKLAVGDICLDYDTLTVTDSEGSLILPQKEFQLLYKLLSYPEKIFTRRQLMDEIWGYDSESDERTVDVHINRLREHFAECRQFKITTVRGLGYKAVIS